MKQLFLFLFCIFSVSSTLSAQESAFTPSGKPILTLFANYHNTIIDKKNSNYFEIGRAYLGYDYRFSENINAVIIMDFGDQGTPTNKYKMSAFLKNAYLRYKKNKFTVDFGIIGTKQMNLTEFYWKNRHIYKTIQDYSKMGYTADLGISFEYQIIKSLSVDASILNDNGFANPYSYLNQTFRAASGITFKPDLPIVFRAYFDYSKGKESRKTLSFLGGYATTKYNLFVEYSNQKGNSFMLNHDYNGLSVFGSLALSKKLGVFARYDYLNSKVLANNVYSWNYNNDGQLAIVGVDYNLAKGVRVSPNIQLWSPKNTNLKEMISFYLSFEAKF